MATHSAVLVFLSLLIRICFAAPTQFKEPYFAANSSYIGLKRSTSQDPSCPSGFLCDQGACPADAICPGGDLCVNFEGTLACIPNAGLSFCAINPVTFEAVGCNNGVCCHGNCYIEGTVCCDDTNVQCLIGKLCNACPSGQTCDGSGCSGGPTVISPPTSTPPKTSTTTKTSVSIPPVTTTLPPPPPPPPVTTTTSAPSPTVVPSVTILSAATFINLGCYADSPDNRVLTNGSSTDFSSTGMTVEKCATLANGYQFAGVEFFGECYWGDIPAYNISESIGDCNAFCDGDPTEVCGGGNRILIYQDSTWVLLTDAEYAAQLQELQSLLLQLETLVAQWQQDLQTYYRAVQAATQTKRKRASISLNQQGVTINLEYQAILALLKPRTIKLKIISLDYFVKIKLSRAQKAAEAAIEGINDVETVANAVTDQLADPVVSVPIIPDGVIPDAAAVEVVADAVSAGTDIVAALGGPEVLVDGVVTVAATGLFATLAAVISHFIPEGGGGEPPNDPTSTTTTKTSSSSTTCSPTMSPTPMVILTTDDTTDAQYKDLILSLPDSSNNVEIVYAIVNFRVLIAEVNDCDIKRLWENPIVEAMSLEGPLILDDEADDPGLPVVTTREDSGAMVHEREHFTRQISNVTANVLSHRALDPLVNLNTQPNSPWHLKLLSGISHQIGDAFLALDGLFNDFEDYLFADRSAGLGSSTSDVTIYLLDVGLRISHNDFAGRNVRAVDMREGQNDPSDSAPFGHGTHVASVAAGNYAGVAKAASIVSVKKDQSVSAVENGIGFILADVVAIGGEGKAVISLSFASNPNTLYPPNLPVPAGGVRVDIIGASFDRFYQRGIVVVCSAGNDAGSSLGALNAKTPRMHGGTSTPLIVVGATEFDESRWSGSQFLDPLNAGILSLYANGVDVVAAWYLGDDMYRTATGSSEATAATSGMVAYLLADNALQSTFAADGLENIATNVKNHLTLLSTTMKGLSRIDPNTNLPDNIPRLANGETVECTPQNGQIVAPIYNVPPELQQFPATDVTVDQVTDGVNFVLTGNIPSCVLVCQPDEGVNCKCCVMM